MPGVNPPSQDWLAAKLTQMDAEIKALKAQRTQFIVDASGNAQAIIGNLATDPQGNPTGLSGFGIACFVEGEWILASGAYPGDLIPGAGTTRPGCLFCDGSSHPVASYPALFGVIGYDWGGSGANFNVPDFRGRSPLGAGTGPGLSVRTLGQTGGEENHLLLAGESGHQAQTIGTENQAHNHSPGNGYSNWLMESGPVTNFGIPLASGGTAAGFPTSNTENQAHNHNTVSVNAASGHNNMQPFAVCNWFVKT